MCFGCERVWSILHVLWSAIYVTCGAAQLVAGIFFLLALPSLMLACNLITGLLNIFIGIGMGMVACCGQISPKRQEILLYMTTSILIINTVNIIFTEYGFYAEDLPKLIEKHQYQTLVQYASFATRIAAAAALLVSFLDTQLTFCSMQSTASNKKKLRGSHEQVSDIEYIIPRPKSAKPQVFNAYSQSWVFESELAANTSKSKSESSPYLKLPQDGTPKRAQSPTKKKIELEINGVVKDTTYLIDNPMVHIEEASDDSNSNSDRKLCYMKSFSRSASPCVLSASSSQISLTHQNHNAPIYEYLEKLTQPETFRSRLNSAKSNTEEPAYQTPQVMVRKSDCTSSPVEKVQYASLMKELQSAIVNKKDSTPPSVTQTNSKSSSRHDSTRSDSDAEFSKELEAALQLIHDLESPNTLDTPSDGKSKEVKALAVWRNNSRSDSEKTLSAVGSLAEIGSPINDCQTELHSFKPPNGKSARVLVQCSDSQSTSGYSSPTHNKSTPKCWSTTSSLNGSHNHLLEKPLSYPIHNHSLQKPESYNQSEKPVSYNQSLEKPVSYPVHNHVLKNPVSYNQSLEKPVSYPIHNHLLEKPVSYNHALEKPVSYPIHNHLLEKPVSYNQSLKKPLSYNQSLEKPLSYPNHKHLLEKPVSYNHALEKPLSYTINNTKSTAVISLYNPPINASNKSKSITLVNINGDNQPIIPIDSSSPQTHSYNRTARDLINDKAVQSMPINPNNVNGWRSLLRKRKQNAPPKLCAELEGAIIKSESLAHLSELELLARHQRNKDMHRQIEQRVQQQLGTPWTDNN